MDDRFVEQWNGSAWSVVDYDSGWRAITPAPAIWDTVSKFQIRRNYNKVTVLARLGSTAGGSGWTATLYQLPTGFVANDYTVKGISMLTNSGLTYGPFIGTLGNRSLLAPAIMTASSPGPALAAGAIITFEISFTTDDPIPTSLPGTLITPAPQ